MFVSLLRRERAMALAPRSLAAPRTAPPSPPAACPSLQAAKMGHSHGYRSGTRYAFSKQVRRRPAGCFVPRERRPRAPSSAAAAPPPSPSLRRRSCRPLPPLCAVPDCGREHALDAVLDAAARGRLCAFGAPASSAPRRLAPRRCRHRRCPVRPAPAPLQVDVKACGSVHKGMPHKYYHGKTGIVYNVTARAVRTGKRRAPRAAPPLSPSRCHRRPSSRPHLPCANPFAGRC